MTVWKKTVSMHGYDNVHMLFEMDGKGYKHRVWGMSMFARMTKLMKGKDGPFDVEITYDNETDPFGCTFITDIKEVSK